MKNGGMLNKGLNLAHKATDVATTFGVPGAGFAQKGLNVVDKGINRAYKTRDSAMSKLSEKDRKKYMKSLIMQDKLKEK